MDFAEERGVHPALCHPSDAEVYAAHLFDNLDFGLSSAAKYWSSIERFYRWMFHHAEYPHRYSPFLIAAVNDDLCHHLWMHAIDKQWPCPMQTTLQKSRLRLTGVPTRSHSTTKSSIRLT